MATFLVFERQAGPEWDASRPMEGQSRWREHADFMNGLEASGFMLLGGPIGDGRVVLAVEAQSEADVRRALAPDPWHETHLLIGAVEPWDIRLDSVRARR